MARKRRPQSGARPAAAGRLRIIGGQWRGRKLTVPDLPGLRPTPDRVRETLFNWLAHDLHGLRCLDLFAGSGALGFEALSRGAGELTLVEYERQAAVQLRDSARILGANAHIEQADALQFLAAGPATAYDLVFVDPPFRLNLWNEVLERLPAWLAPGHRVYLEAPRDWPGPDAENWQTLKEKTAADVKFCLLQQAPSEA